MPQWRKLHVKATESLDINDMPDDFHRLLWILLPLKLCREGRGLDSPAWVRSNVFPLREDVSLDMVATAMDWYARRGMIVRYAVEGRCYFYVPSWERHQGNTSKEAESIYPEPLPTTEEVPGYSGPTPDLLQTNSSTDADADADAEEMQSSGADAPAPDPPKRPRKAKPKDPPPEAVEVVRSATNYYPAKPLWPGIQQVVGADPPNLDRWRRVCLGWVACGWNPKNVKGMLQHYSEGKIPGDDRGNHSRASPKEPGLWPALREFAAEGGITLDGI